ncbi:MAG: hypothetical protein H0X63_10450 [Flavobacteriales bacterium]|nr:hypothetical protein [Flavobacteriales bacterium]
MRPFFYLLTIALLVSCDHKPHKDTHHHSHDSDAPYISEIKKQLIDEGFEFFEVIDPETQDTLIMQKYFMAFLKLGEIRMQSNSEADSLQKLHLEHLGRMYNEGFADISGPFGDEGEARGITIYNVPSLHVADSLANLDPMVQAGRLAVEIRPWWAAKGFKLR